jgi:hypothetical protein
MLRRWKNPLSLIQMVYTYFQEFDAMLKSSIPEIQRCNLTNVVLQLLALEIDALTFNFLDKPPKEVSSSGGSIHSPSTYNEGITSI